MVEQVRVAHFDGQRWSNLGAINRNTSSSMRPPAAANAPAIAIGPTGNAVVVWQEPDVEGVGADLGPAPVRQLRGLRDAGQRDHATTGSRSRPTRTRRASAFSRLGQAEVAYRQAGRPGLAASRAADLPEHPARTANRRNGAEFAGAKVVDDQASAGVRRPSSGPPSIDIDEQQGMRLLYDANGTPRVIEGAGSATFPGVSLGPPFAGSEPFAVSVMNPQGGGVSAWPSEESPAIPAVAVREDFPSGAVQTALVSGGAGGEVGELGRRDDRASATGSSPSARASSETRRSWRHR